MKIQEEIKVVAFYDTHCMHGIRGREGPSVSDYSSLQIKKTVAKAGFNIG